MKTTKSKMKNTLDGNNSRLDTPEEKISEPEHILIATVQNGSKKEGRKERALVSCGTIPSNLI